MVGALRFRFAVKAIGFAVFLSSVELGKTLLTNNINFSVEISQ
jgi:hypothetical protein